MNDDTGMRDSFNEKSHSVLKMNRVFTLRLQPRNIKRNSRNKLFHHLQTSQIIDSFSIRRIMIIAMCKSKGNSNWHRNNPTKKW